jgi:hypothetical protein
LLRKAQSEVKSLKKKLASKDSTLKDMTKDQWSEMKKIKASTELLKKEKYTLEVAQIESEKEF